MNVQNPKPRSRQELEAMLDARMSGLDVLKLLPNPVMSGFNAGHEIRKLHEEELRQRFGGGDFID